MIATSPFCMPKAFLPLGDFMLTNIAKAFDDYFAIITEVNKLALERGESDALKLVKLRRQLSQSISDMQQAVDETAQAHDLQEASVPELKEHREMFSAERSAVAGHQAKWNAPAMLQDRKGYEAGCRELLAMHKRNHQWRKDVLVPALERAVRQSR
jgi:hypothetical protein